MKLNLGFCLSLFSAVLVGGCRESGPIAITTVRQLDVTNTFEAPVIEESDLKRLRIDQLMPAAGRSAGDREKPSAAMDYTAPEGWTELPPAEFREINLAFGENREGECYVTTLGSVDVTGNVNRWRRQMGAEPLTEEGVAELPKKPLLGAPATLVVADGVFSGMGSAPKENYRLMGLILALDGAMVTVKMTGPKPLVMENEAKFDAFCASLSRKTRD